MLFESLVADTFAYQARPSIANGPHGEWCRNHWDENCRSIQSWLRAGTPSTDPPLAEGERDGVVLVVDDEPAIAITLSQILGRHWYPAVWLTDPRSAAILFDKLPLKLLVTDIDMPGMDGVALATLARNNAKCPVLLLSARGEECHAAGGLCALDPGIHIQTKPVGVHTLLNRVRFLCTSEIVSPTLNFERNQEVQHRVPEVAME